MPKTKTRSARRAPSKAAAGNGAAAPTLDQLRAYADALYRWAAECCRQHDRYSRMIEGDTLEPEERAWCTIVETCDRTLGEMVAAYEKGAEHLHPDGDQAWWHRANGLWHASREYLRRHRDCDGIARRFEDHSAGRLGSLQLEYELEASALLALRHAAEAYQKSCPECS